MWVTQAVTVACNLNNVPRKPVRPVLRVRREYQLVGRELPQRVVRDLDRIVRSDHPACADPHPCERLHSVLEMVLGLGARAVITVQWASREPSAGATTSASREWIGIAMNSARDCLFIGTSPSNAPRGARASSPGMN
jgi:hypothetical protein